MFKWYERLRCKHEWELMMSKGNTTIYACKYCGKMITADRYGKKPLNHYSFAVDNINNISNGSFTFNELLNQRVLLLSCISILHPELFRRQHKDIWGTRLVDNFKLTFKYGIDYYVAFTLTLSSEYEHLFNHIKLDDDAYLNKSVNVTFSYAIKTMVEKIRQGVNMEAFYPPKYDSALQETISKVSQGTFKALSPDDARQIVKEELNKIYGVENAENGSFTPEAFYKKEDEESSHLNVCGKSTDEEDWEDYPED